MELILVNGHHVWLTTGQYFKVIADCGLAGVLSMFLMWAMWSNML